ncbi:hypothetical protein MKX03_006166 [Papaver bracteatum]|nr:hypothetical protein MKX03_006166 [Papaver bracteatum]
MPVPKKKRPLLRPFPKSRPPESYVTQVPVGIGCEHREKKDSVFEFRVGGDVLRRRSRRWRKSMKATDFGVLTWN